MRMTRWDVLDWRRQVAALYREVRLAPTPEEAHALWVSGRSALLATHRASPVPPEVREGWSGPAHLPYDPALRFVVPVDDAEPRRWDVTTGTDGVVPFERVGRVTLPDLGSLDVWWLAGYGGGVFLPVRDPAEGSYGGGRYLLDTVKGADLGGDGEGLVVDLNFAYQPSCAYDPMWACPLAGPENTLAAPVEAGEQYVDLGVELDLG